MNWVFAIGWILSRFVARVVMGMKVQGLENIPPKGPVIVAVNHQSYLDPPLVGSMIRRELHFFAKKELFDIPMLSGLFRKVNAFPVRRGVYDPQSLSWVQGVLSAGKAVMIFPEGTRNDGVHFLPPKPGIGLIARKTGAPIIPAYACGLNRTMAAIFRRCRVRVLFGRPISGREIMTFGDEKEGYRALAELVMARIRELKEDLALS